MGIGVTGHYDYENHPQTMRALVRFWLSRIASRLTRS